MKKQKIQPYFGVKKKGKFKLAKALGDRKYEDVLNRKGKPITGSWSKIKKMIKVHELKYPNSFFSILEIRTK